MRGVNSQVNGQIADALVAASDSVCFILDLLHNRGEIWEFLSLCVQKLSILDRPIDKLENQGTSCDNTRASRQEVPEIIMFTLKFFSFWVNILIITFQQSFPKQRIFLRTVLLPQQSEAGQ